jgi:Na+/H+ antiporter NhaD/arsenite permease-like protein
MFGSFPLLDRKPSFMHFQDPIILSGTAFLAYMTRAASNILNPRAWIHAQFAIANISSAILVSSNPTNLVLAGAFDIKFIDYTVNMVNPSLVELTQHS